MDFADYGDRVGSSESARYLVNVPNNSLYWYEKNEEQWDVRVINATLMNLVSFLGTPAILITDKDPRFTGSTAQEFRRNLNITPQMVIPGHPQSHGPTGRRRWYFRDITQQIKNGKTKKKVGDKDWQECASMCMLRLNSRVQQCGGSAPGQRVFSGTPKFPIGTAVNSPFKDSIFRNDAPVTQTHDFLADMGGGNSNSGPTKRFPLKIQFSLKNQVSRPAKRTVLFTPDCLFTSRR